MQISTPVLGALAAFGGSIIGACASVATTLVGQRLQTRGARIAAELDQHAELYGRFLEQAVPLFIDAIGRTEIDTEKIMQLYALLAHIRLTAGDEVLHAAEEVGRRLLDAYHQPPQQTQAVIARIANGDHEIDPLREFTEACRRERARAELRINQPL